MTHLEDSIITKQRYKFKKELRLHLYVLRNEFIIIKANHYKQMQFLFYQDTFVDKNDAQKKYQQILKEEQEIYK